VGGIWSRVNFDIIALIDNRDATPIPSPKKGEFKFKVQRYEQVVDMTGDLVM
jgi:hypothetical protein